MGPFNLVRRYHWSQFRVRYNDIHFKGPVGKIIKTLRVHHFKAAIAGTKSSIKINLAVILVYPLASLL